MRASAATASRALGLLHVAEHAVEQHDDRDHDRIDRPAAALDCPGNERNGDRPQQQVDQRVLELRQHQPPARCRRGGAQLVRSVPRQAAGRFGAAQAALEIGFADARDLPASSVDGSSSAGAGLAASRPALTCAGASLTRARSTNASAEEAGPG
jgi:hypothetical protein